ncbi:protein daughter of sevenless [Euwallacea fornicatus]|uniref:protein daughter of sevenless n=1 Tax=Euwallacea fornicatus TaxID=995702 RepID=UPI00338FAA8E
MAKSQEEVVFEGWLTKSPPSKLTKRIWRAKWRRRWFLLTHSGDIPGQYVLTYYTNRTHSKLKGVIDLDHCEQVDLGLKLEEKNLKFEYIFRIKTPHRNYFLAADTEDEMKAWVTCICRVCGLKSTNEEEDLAIPMTSPDIEITEETLVRTNGSPPISPVSTSPYIHVSDCITGKSPIFDLRDSRCLLEYNQNRSTSQPNDLYDSHNSYVNYTRDPDYVNELQDPRFYDCPRQLVPQKPKREPSPLRSPTNSDSVFNDEEWTPQNVTDASKIQSRPSDGSIELEESRKDNHLPAPPRPPKPSHIGSLPQTGYLNLAPVPVKTREEKLKSIVGLKVISDDMYDFPRSHNVDTLESKGGLQQRRHCYNNAAPTKCPEGTIFRYDESPKATTSSMFKYDPESTQEFEPSSPAHSHSSSTPAYSNLPSPLLADVQMMPPPSVNRDLKPRRKKSDSLSTSSTAEPPSPRIAAPSVDRKLKPPTPLQEAHMRKSFHAPDEEGAMKRRAAPSPTPPAVTENLYQNHQQSDTYQYVTNHMQYLDLVLEPSSPSSSGAKKSGSKTNESDTVYKEVDFMKTEAFNITRNNLEKERQEPVTTFVKK